MTEQEAIKRIKEKHCTENQNCTDSCMHGAEHCAYSMAIKALEEIQQYRAIGTVEELEWCKDASHWKELFKEKLEQYEAIGTIEEFKALKEKAEPKKPVGLHKNICPSCSWGIVKRRQKICYECGQKLDSEV